MESTETIRGHGKGPTMCRHKSQEVNPGKTPKPFLFFPQCHTVICDHLLSLLNEQAFHPCHKHTPKSESGRFVWILCLSQRRGISAANIIGSIVFGIFFCERKKEKENKSREGTSKIAGDLGIIFEASAEIGTFVSLPSLNFLSHCVDP